MRDHREFGGVHRAKEKLCVHDPGNHRRNPVRARHVHVPGARVGRLRAGRRRRGRGRGRAAGHGLRPAEDGGQARGALERQGGRNRSAGRRRGAGAGRGHVHDHDLEHAGARHPDRHRGHRAAALPHPAHQGPEVREALSPGEPAPARRRPFFSQMVDGL